MVKRLLDIRREKDFKKIRAMLDRACRLLGKPLMLVIYDDDGGTILMVPFCDLPPAAYRKVLQVMASASDTPTVPPIVDGIVQYTKDGIDS